MVQGGATFVKYLIFFFNLLFVIIGLAVIIVGAIIQARAQTYFDFLGRGFSSTAVLLIVVGVIIFLIAFFGCCGAIKENHCMVITFSVLLFIIFILELSAGIAAYVYRAQLKDIVKTGMGDNFDKYANDTDVQKTWDDMQSNLKCCGVSNYTDYVVKGWTIPESCFLKPAPHNETSIFKKGCADVLFSDFERYQTTIGGVGIGVCVIQLVGIAFACCLARAIKKQYEVV